MKLTLSANAGLAIEIGGKRIWVDALHTRKQPGFSCVDDELQKKMLSHPAFQKPDIICYTHCHPDHYSRSLTEAACRIWPKAVLLVPGQTVPAGDKWGFSLKDLTVTFFRLPHEGQQYADTLHYGIFIQCGQENVLLSGDCAVGCEEMKGMAPEICVVDFPWIALPKGRKVLREGICPGKIVACHIPFAGDDVNGYREAAAKAADLLENVYLLQEPLQTIEI
jgi:L-ascorbate metabolism protein UlaG (beta-lactamase superfamily)